MPRAIRRSQRKGANKSQDDAPVEKGTQPVALVEPTEEEEATSATTVEKFVKDAVRKSDVLDWSELFDGKSDISKDALAPTIDCETERGPQQLNRKGDTSALFTDSSFHSTASAKVAAYPSTNQSSVTMVPIAPGLSARLRGANETWECIEDDFYLPTTCFACSLELCVIMDADFVICPICRVVSPIDHGDTSSPDLSHATREQTVGLGFTFEDLAKWQEEIVSKKNRPTF